jgi:hypothetical protein
MNTCAADDAGHLAARNRSDLAPGTSELALAGDHGELAAGQRDGTAVGAPDGGAIAGWTVAQALHAPAGEALAGAVELATLQGCQEIGLVAHAAVLQPIGEGACDQGLLAPLQGFLDLVPEAHGRGLDPMPADQLAVEPGGIGATLPVEIDSE